TGEFKISTKNDWISILQDEKYLAQLKSFEYVAIMSENVQGYLPADFIPGESVAYIPTFLLHYILEEKHSEQIKDDISTLFDLGLTVGTFGSYAAGKKVLLLASKSAQGALIDFGIQTLFLTLDGTSWEDAVNQVDYANVAWAATSIHISQSKMTYTLNCIRQAGRGALKPDNESLKDAMIQAGESCLLDAALTYISSGLVSNTDKYSRIVLNKLTKNPAFVTKRLLKYGVSETAVQSFKGGITKESIKKTIDKTIKEYEQENK
ncbi:hypothetical protein, partial [Labilibaculum euxinus]|uniref:hypothetical protein n=1 Tax=Labilibaculum euxinus TaxID=2686357 RepID=UPI0018CF5976